MAEPRGRDVEQRQRGEREEREARAARDEDDRDRDHLDRARDRERDQQHDVVDLLDVGVGVGHELAGLRPVVEREVQRLEVRDEPHAQVALDPHREPERGVPANAGARRAWTAPTARISSIQLRAAVQSPLATPWFTAAPASAGTATRAAAQTRPAKMPTNIILRCTRTASRIRRQPALRLARASSTDPSPGCETRRSRDSRGHEAAMPPSTPSRQATSGPLTPVSGFRGQVRTPRLGLRLRIRAEP